jgi:hypothetical protein
VCFLPGGGRQKQIKSWSFYSLSLGWTLAFYFSAFWRAELIFGAALLESIAAPRLIYVAN